MTRRVLFYKWFWYLMAIVPLCIAEEHLFNRLRLFGVAPVLLPLAAVAAAMLEGPAAGGSYGLVVGLFCVASWPGEGWIFLLPLTLAGILVGVACQYGLRPGYPGCLLCSAGVLAVVSFLRILIRLLWERAELLPMLELAARELVVSLPFALPVYFLYSRVYAKVGGTRLM